MSSSQKKVIVRRFQGDLRYGYLAAGRFVEAGSVSFLDLEGRLDTLPLAEIKTICYVRDFNLGDSSNPERLLRRTFLARPRGDGLWVRLALRDDADLLEGLATSDRALLDELSLLDGLHLAPPDTRSNTQRIFVPRLAIASLSILAVITSPSARARATPVPTPAPLQSGLFDQSNPDKDAAPAPARGPHGSK